MVSVKLGMNLRLAFSEPLPRICRLSSTVFIHRAMSSEAQVQRPAKIRRMPNACIACRKAKKTCEGQEAPCKRCKANDIECIFEKPKSNLVNDAGLTRLSAIEAATAHLERRTDAILESLGQIHSLLSSQGRSPQATAIVSHNPPVLPAAQAASQRQSASELSRPLQQESVSPASREAGSASAQSDDLLSRIETSFGQPINALMEVSKAVLGDIARKTGTSKRSAEDSVGDEPVQARRRMMQRGECTAQKDTQALYLSDRDARAWYLLWFKEICPFCPIFDQEYDTYERVRQTSPFLYHAILYIAIRASASDEESFKLLERAQESVMGYARALVFDSSPSVETIQAYLCLACFHTEPYLYSGIAMRLALCANYEAAYSRLVALPQEAVDLQRLYTAQFRTYLYAAFLDFKHSRYTGKVIPSRLEDLQDLVSYSDRLLNLPHTLPNDSRHVSNLQYVMWERSVLEESKHLVDPSLIEHRKYVQDKEAEIKALFAKYDTVASSYFTELAYSRRSGQRIYHDAVLYLAVNVYKQDLFDSVAMPADIVRYTADHAHQAIRTVLDSPNYVAGIVYGGYLLRVDLSFAGVILLKLAAAHSTVVDSDRVFSDVLQLANVLERSHDAARYADMLKKFHLICEAHLRQPEVPWLDFSNQYQSQTVDCPRPMPQPAASGLDLWNDSDILLNHDWLSAFTTDDTESWWNAYTTLG